jgi:hypothetical protein
VKREEEEEVKVVSVLHALTGEKREVSITKTSCKAKQSKVKLRKMKNKNNFLNASQKKMRNVFFFLEIVTIAIF